MGYRPITTTKKYKVKSQTRDGDQILITYKSVKDQLKQLDTQFQHKLIINNFKQPENPQGVLEKVKRLEKELVRAKEKERHNTLKFEREKLDLERQAFDQLKRMEEDRIKLRERVGRDRHEGDRMIDTDKVGDTNRNEIHRLKQIEIDRLKQQEIDKLKQQEIDKLNSQSELDRLKREYEERLNREKEENEKLKRETEKILQRENTKRLDKEDKERFDKEEEQLKRLKEEKERLKIQKEEEQEQLKRQKEEEQEQLKRQKDDVARQKHFKNMIEMAKLGVDLDLIQNQEPKIYTEITPLLENKNYI